MLSGHLESPKISGGTIAVGAGWRQEFGNAGVRECGGAVFKGVYKAKSSPTRSRTACDEEAASEKSPELVQVILPEPIESFISSFVLKDELNRMLLPFVRVELQKGCAHSHHLVDGDV